MHFLLMLIYNLKKKYASSVNASLDEVFQFYNDAIKRLEELSNGEKNKENLLSDISVLENKIALYYLDYGNLPIKQSLKVNSLISPV